MLRHARDYNYWQGFRAGRCWRSLDERLGHAQPRTDEADVLCAPSFLGLYVAPTEEFLPPPSQTSSTSMYVAFTDRTRGMAASVREAGPEHHTAVQDMLVLYTAGRAEDVRDHDRNEGEHSETPLAHGGLVPEEAEAVYRSAGNARLALAARRPGGKPAQLGARRAKGGAILVDERAGGKLGAEEGRGEVRPSHVLPRSFYLLRQFALLALRKDYHAARAR